MATRNNVLTQAERAFWREMYKEGAAQLIARYGAKARVLRVGSDAAAHADEAIRQLRIRRNLWGRP